MASQKTRKNQQKDSSSAKRSKPVSKGGDSGKSAAKPKASVKAEKGKPEKVKLVKKAKPEPSKPEKAKLDKKAKPEKVKPDKKAKPEPSKPEKVNLEKKAKPEPSKPEKVNLEKKAIPEKGKLEKAAPEKAKPTKGKPEKAKIEKGAPEKLLKSAKAEAPKMREAVVDKPRKVAEAPKETAKEPPKKAPEKAPKAPEKALKAPEKALKAPEKSPPVKGAAVPAKKAPEREEIQPVKRPAPPAPPPPVKGKEPPKGKPAVAVGKPEGKEAKPVEKKPVAKPVEPKAMPVPKAMPKEEPKARKEAAPPAQREITPKLVPLTASAAAALGKRGTTEERAIELEKRIDAQPDEFKKRYYDSFDMSWIYHDSALEGVVYTFEELRAALFPQPVTSDSNLQPSVEDIRRHKEAILFVRDFATKKRLPITVDLIKKIYLILHPEEGDVKTVKYRKDIPQHRLYFHEYAPPDKIAYKVRQVVDWLNDPETRKTRNGIRIAARAHFDLLKVYPFPTDSGKVARLFMNLLLMRSGLPPSIIHSTERQRYYEGLKSSATTVLQMVQEAVENALASVEKLLNEHETGKRAFIS